MDEIWKDIEGWQGKYEVSNTGLVRITVKTRHKQPGDLIVSSPSTPSGYWYVNLYREGKDGVRRPLHQLVLETFGPAKPSVKHEPDHIDRDKSNNCIQNLVWKTHKENSANRKNGPPTIAKLSQERADEIRSRLGSVSQRQLAYEYGVSPQTITLIKQDAIWRRSSI